MPKGRGYSKARKKSKGRKGVKGKTLRGKIGKASKYYQGGGKF